MTRGREYVDLIVLRNKNGQETIPSRFIRELINISNYGKQQNISLPEEMNKTSFDFLTGDIVKHKSFGEGEVVNIDIPKGIINVKFHDYGIKNLSYKICVDNKILTKVY